ncbi:unnamed protein product [Dicrocoelium dendriticum]|nr:unnamed protein product [Dicrocoelium dendriticum]
MDTEDPVGLEDKDEEEEAGEQSDEDMAVSASVRRLTEGEIDVDDGDSASGDDDQAEGDDADDAEDTLSPQEKAARICRLPSKELTNEELSLFPFLEDCPRALRDAYLCVRNFACLSWSEDPGVQVTPAALSTYVMSNMSTENIRLMIDAGIAAPPVGTGPIHLGCISSASSQSDDVTRTKTSKEPITRSNTRHLAVLSLPPMWSPWSNISAKSNLDKLCYYAVLFLERFGHINFGVFKIISAPLTHISGCRGTSAPETLTDTPSLRRTGSERSLHSARRGASPSKPGAAHPPHIIVLGAGISGLMTARQLTYFGAKVTILESRDRVGGRIWTCKRNDAYGELGAMVVTGLSANPVAVLAKQIPLTLIPINIECCLYDPRGRQISREMDERVEEEFNGLLGTAAYMCHAKSLDSIMDGGVERPLSLGEVVELLIRYQERHMVQLKITHRKLIIKLLERKNDLLDRIAVAREAIEEAHERWQTAAARANTCSVVTPKVLGSLPFTTSNETNHSGIQMTASAPSKRPGDRTKDSRLSSRSKLTGEVNSCTDGVDGQNVPPKENSTAAAAARPCLPVYNVSAQFEVRRLLSDLHDAWKRFDPLQAALNRVNRQLDILMQSPPRDSYLTEAERRILDWHLANLEFANATELNNLSLRHWDQDDMFELSGEHCIIRDGYSALTDALATAITTSQTSLVANQPVGVVNSKQRDSSAFAYTLGSGHIELKSLVKRILYSDSGVRVEALNAAFSQEDLIEHEADAVICTLPLGVLKESVQVMESWLTQPKDTDASDTGVLTKLTAPVFEPPLPTWKVDAIKRLGFGVLNKVVLIFEKSFWDRSQNLFGHLNSSPESRGELFLFWSIPDRPVLIALVAGRAAVDLERSRPSPIRSSPGSRLSTPGGTSLKSHSSGGIAPSATLQEPIVAKAMHILRGIFGSSDSSTPSYGGQNQCERRRIIPHPIDAIVTRWYSDPDSRGSYSYVKVGATGSDYDLLGDSVCPTISSVDPLSQIKTSPSPKKSYISANMPRLFFAGEHTCRCYPATVHGAMLTGLREAARVANAYFPGPTPILHHNLKLSVPASQSV